MFAFEGPDGCVEDECDAFPVAPLGPGLAFDDWWVSRPRKCWGDNAEAVLNISVSRADLQIDTPIACGRC